MNAFEEQEYSKRIDLTLWRRLVSYAAAYRGHLAALALVMIAVAVIDAVFPLLTRHAVDTFIVPGQRAGLPRFAALYAGLVVIQSINVWLLVAVAGRIEVGVSFDLRRNGFRHLQELSLTYYDRTPAGWIMARMTSDVTRVGEVISWGLVDIVWGTTMMVAFAVFMLVMNVRLALIVLAVAPFLVAASLYFQKRILASHREMRRMNSRISGAYNEGIMGARTTKTLVREAENLREFQGLTSGMKRASVRTALFSALYLPVVLTLGSIGTALVLWSGGTYVAHNVLTYGTIVAFISYTVQFFEPAQELARVITELQSAQAAAERVISMIETPVTIRDTPELARAYGDVFSYTPGVLARARGDLRFERVSFSYSSGEQVLSDFSLSVPAGQTVALVGETGSGKSTIVNLACRFYEPDSGSILIDGVDYRNRPLGWLHAQLGYVLQTPYLRSGTIRENIRYGNLAASDADIEEAARIVHLDHFIRRMPAGFETEVGEGGGLLSTGEKQLVSFARALVADPVFFVLDEATSSVDTETELIIQEAVQRVLAGRTSFVIAHRLSTIREADRILVIQNGEIMEDGTHHELLSQRGHYYSLYTQSGEISLT